MSYKVASFSKFILLGAACAPLMLAACASDNGPYAMPSGYTHHGDVNKAPNGPELSVIEKRSKENTMPAPDIQAEEPRVKAAKPAVVNPQSLETGKWQTAADTLVRDMTMNFGQPAEAVYVTKGKSVEDMSLAAALRNALTDNQIDVTEQRGMSPFTMSYAVAAPMDRGDSRKMVKIMLSDYDKTIAEEAGLFHVGHSGHRKMDTPSMTRDEMTRDDMQSGGQPMHEGGDAMHDEPMHHDEYRAKDHSGASQEKTMMKDDHKHQRTQHEHENMMSGEDMARQDNIKRDTGQQQEPAVPSHSSRSGMVPKVKAPQSEVNRPTSTFMTERRRLAKERNENAGAGYHRAPMQNNYDSDQTYNRTPVETSTGSGRVVPMPTMDGADADNTYGESRPMPLESSRDDR